MMRFYWLDKCRYPSSGEKSRPQDVQKRHICQGYCLFWQKLDQSESLHFSKIITCILANSHCRNRAVLKGPKQGAPWSKTPILFSMLRWRIQSCCCCCCSHPKVSVIMAAAKKSELKSCEYTWNTRRMIQTERHE